MAPAHTIASHEGMKSRGKLLEAATSSDDQFADASWTFANDTIYREALQLAVRGGNLQMVGCILKKWSAQLDTKFLIGCYQGMVSSPIFVAVKAGHLEVVRMLVTHTMNLVKEDDLKPMTMPSEIHMNEKRKLYWFQELVRWAVRWGHVSIVGFLLPEYQRLFDLSTADDMMALALHLAAFHGHLDVLQMILEWDQGSRCQTASSFLIDGLTALHLAAQSGSVGAVDMLVNVGKVDGIAVKHPEILTPMDGTEVSHPENFTPLHLAANSGHVEVVNYLLATAWARSHLVSGIMARDCLGRTALHYAARAGHVRVVQALVNAHQDIALVSDYDGLLALHMAARAGHVEVIKVLNPLGGFMCKAKNSLAVKRWVECEYRLNGGIRDRCSLTFYPGKEWRFPRVKLFDSLFWRTEGFTPLHFAARYGYGAAVEELLNNRDACFSALFCQDSGRFLAYDWMKVQGQGRIFVACADRGFNLDDVDLTELELDKRSLSSKITSKMSLSIASDIREEMQAMEELQRVWQSGLDGIEDAIKQMPVFLWLLEDIEEVGDAPWHELASLLNVKPYGFGALDQALQKGNFTAAKQMLRQYPRADLRLDANRVFSRVEQLLSVTSYKGLPNSLRALEDFLIVLVTTNELALGIPALHWLARWAREEELTSLLGMILDRSDLKRGLYEDRQLFVDCANTMLIGATLIAWVAFQAWLQYPLGYSYTYGYNNNTQYAHVHRRSPRAFWWFNNASFFFAMASLIAGAKGSVPAKYKIDLLDALRKVRTAVGVASFFLGIALLCVVGAFTAAGFIILPPIPSDLAMMRKCVGLGTSFCALTWLWFALGVLPLVSETIQSYLVPRLKDLLLSLCFLHSLYSHDRIAP